MALYSCKQPSIISQQLSTSDSLIIQFFNDDEVIYKAVTSLQKTDFQFPKSGSHCFLYLLTWLKFLLLFLYAPGKIKNSK
jgi:hypothetical protein